MRWTTRRHGDLSRFRPLEAREVMRRALLLSLLAAPVEAATYYVAPAPAGNDGNVGSELSPFRTLQHAHDLAQPGDLIYLRGGVHLVSAQVELTRSGSSGAPIRVFAFPGEHPILDGNGITVNATWVIRLRGSASWWHLRGLEIRNNPWGGGITLRDSASHNIIENNDIHHNGRLSDWAASGISMYDSPTDNLILNNDVHHNADLDFGDGDGMSLGNSGTGNVFRGNRAWRNSDDGYDFFCVRYTAGPCAPAVFEDNWAFENGLNDALMPLGNGVGIKLGGTRPGVGSSSGGHTVRRCVSWANRAGGFDENCSSCAVGANVPMTLHNNTAWNNGDGNFVFWSPPGSPAATHVFRNNLSFGNLGHVEGSATFNSWTLPVTISAADFASTADTCARGPRQADGSLPNCPFLRLVAGSDLVNAGTNVGLPFVGTAPDLGAFEFVPTGGGTGGGSSGGAAGGLGGGASGGTSGGASGGTSGGGASGGTSGGLGGGASGGTSGGLGGGASGGTSGGLGGGASGGTSGGLGGGASGGTSGGIAGSGMMIGSCGCSGGPGSSLLWSGLVLWLARRRAFFTR